MSLNMKDLRVTVHKNDFHFFFLKTKIIYYKTSAGSTSPPRTTHGKDPFLPARICWNSSLFFWKFIMKSLQLQSSLHLSKSDKWFWYNCPQGKLSRIIVPWMIVPWIMPPQKIDQFHLKTWIEMMVI